jgi:Effector Associated Constant Component 1
VDYLAELCLKFAEMLISGDYGEIMGLSNLEEAELSVSDYAQLGQLMERLREGVPHLQMARIPGRPGRGEQGALDVLMIAADSSVLVAVIQVASSFLQTRKKGTSVTLTTKGKKVTLTGYNPEEVISILEQLPDD